jgi:hypothetical protein
LGHFRTHAPQQAANEVTIELATALTSEIWNIQISDEITTPVI